MRVLVTGGRGFSDGAFVFALLDALHERRAVTAIIHGTSPGAAASAAHWAALRGIPEEPFEADHEAHGAAAEAIRNTRMIAAGPDLVVVLPGGRHTAICRRQAEAAGLKVFVPVYRGAVYQPCED